MLILTRRVGETLMIDDDVTVTVLGVKGNQVRIGINAPKEVSSANHNGNLNTFRYNVFDFRGILDNPFCVNPKLLITL